MNIYFTGFTECKFPLKIFTFNMAISATVENLIIWWLIGSYYDIIADI